MKTRLISAAVGIALLIIMMVFNATPVLPIFIALAGMIAVWEIYSVSHMTKPGLPVFILSELYALSMPFVFRGYTPLNTTTLYFAYIFIFAIIMLIQYQKINMTKAFYTAFMSFFVCMSLCSVVNLFDKMNGKVYYFVVACLCAFITDTGAYIFGRLFGRHKLSSTISPNKTIEGAVGGLLLCIIVTVMFSYGYVLIAGSDTKVNITSVIFLTFLASILGMVGDLFASMQKRNFNVKDFGFIMPGHGGIMDRFDSLFFTAPFIAVVSNYFPFIA